MAIAPANASVAVLATGGATPRDLEKALKRAQEQRLKCQKAGNAKGEVSSLISIADVYLLQAGLGDAVEAASEALELARKAKDPQTELVVHLVLAYLQAASGDAEAAKALVSDASTAVRRAGEVPWSEAAQQQLETLRLVTDVLSSGQRGSAPPLASALCALGHICVATGNPSGLAAAKEAMDLFEQAGDERGAAVAAYALAIGHIMAGHAEDAERQKLFLPMATHHAAAAGAAAEKAHKYFRKLGFEDGVRATQALLDMQRLQMTAHLRTSQPFHYPTWETVNPK